MMSIDIVGAADSEKGTHLPLCWPKGLSGARIVILGSMMRGKIGTFRLWSKWHEFRDRAESVFLEETACVCENTNGIGGMWVWANARGRLGVNQ